MSTSAIAPPPLALFLAFEYELYSILLILFSCYRDDPVKYVATLVYNTAFKKAPDMDHISRSTCVRNRVDEATIDRISRATIRPSVISHTKVAPGSGLP